MLYLRLKRQAETQRRSFSAEIITLLKWAVEEIDRRSAVTLDGIRQRRSFNPGAVDAPDTRGLGTMMGARIPGLGCVVDVNLRKQALWKTTS
jgi:hypothetical protein